MRAGKFFLMQFFAAAVLISAVSGCKHGAGKENNTPPALELQSISIHGMSVDKSNWKVEVANGKKSVKASDVTAVFNYGRERNKPITVTVENGTLAENRENEVKLSIPATAEHGAWTQTVKVRRAGISSDPVLKLVSLTVHGMSVNKEKPEIELSNNIAEVKSEKIKAVFDYGDKIDQPITVNVSGGMLKEGEVTPVQLGVPASSGNYQAWNLTVKIKRLGIGEDPQPVLTSLKIHKEPVDRNTWKVSVKNSSKQVRKENVEATFLLSGEVKSLDIEVENAPVNLTENAETDVTLKVNAKPGEYKQWKQTVKVTRLAKTDDPALVPENITVHKIPADKTTWTVRIPNKEKTITADDVHAEFKLGGHPRTIPVTVENCPAELTPGTETPVTLKVAAKEGEYTEWKQVIKVTRENPVQPSPSAVDFFSVDGVPYAVNTLNENKIIEVKTLKPLIKLAVPAGKKFTLIASADFEEPVYANEYHFEADLKLKNNLAKNAETPVSITVTTKSTNAAADDAPLNLSFKLKLPAVTLEVESVSIGTEKITAAGKTLNVISSPVEIQVIFKSVCAGMVCSIEKGGTKIADGKIQANIVTFSKLALTEGNNNLTLKASGANAEEITFAFNVNYTKPQADGIIIQSVEVAGKEIAENETLTVNTKTAPVIVKLQGTYQNPAVKIDNIPFTQPFAPGNPNYFKGSIANIAAAEKTVTVNVTADNKTAKNFVFKIKYEAPPVTANVLVKKVTAVVEDEYNPYEGVEKNLTKTDNTFNGSVGADKIIGFNIYLDSSKLGGKDINTLKAKVTKDGTSKDASFNSGADSPAKISLTVPDISAAPTVFTLEILENGAVIEIYTLSVKQ